MPFRRTLCLVPAACMVILAGGCESAAVDVDSGEVIRVEPGEPVQWIGKLDLTIGGDDAGTTFRQPIPLGSDSGGTIYILDRPELEIRAFTDDGVAVTTVVRAGQGPGEMRLPAFTHGLIGDTIWFSELTTGRVVTVSTRGTARATEETGFAPERLGAEVTFIHRLPAGRGYWVEARHRPEDVSMLRPTHRFDLLRGTSATDARVVHSWHHLSTSLFFDNGGTLVRYPGAYHHKLVLLFRDGDRFVEVDRTVHETRGAVTAQVRLFSATRGLLHSRTIAAPAVPISAVARDSMEQVIVDQAMFEGARTLDRQVRDRIADFVRSIPPVLPAVAAAAAGPDDTVWLRLSMADPDAESDWLVLDSGLNAMGRAQMPGNVLVASYLPDGRWWVTLSGPHDTRYIGRLAF